MGDNENSEAIYSFIRMCIIALIVCVGCYVFFSTGTLSRVTVVTITDSTATFKSNKNHTGDEYYIIKNGDTLSRGVYFNQKWR